MADQWLIQMDKDNENRHKIRIILYLFTADVRSYNNNLYLTVKQAVGKHMAQNKDKQYIRK